jgi:hypothetical protein
MEGEVPIPEPGSLGGRRHHVRSVKAAGEDAKACVGGPLVLGFRGIGFLPPSHRYADFPGNCLCR